MNSFRSSEKSAPLDHYINGGSSGGSDDDPGSVGNNPGDGTPRVDVTFSPPVRAVFGPHDTCTPLSTLEPGLEICDEYLYNFADSGQFADSTEFPYKLYVTYPNGQRLLVPFDAFGHDRKTNADTTGFAVVHDWTFDARADRGIGFSGSNSTGAPLNFQFIIEDY